ncbi:hypothetical protein PF003_g27712 [Phytophthora fragariae]|nr:hypothetical protein PF003_g27712 [Phytophthora fragariae]
MVMQVRRVEEPWGVHGDVGNDTLLPPLLKPVLLIK